jgi:hypothetical protein
MGFNKISQKSLRITQGNKMKIVLYFRKLTAFEFRFLIFILLLLVGAETSRSSENSMRHSVEIEEVHGASIKNAKGGLQNALLKFNSTFLSGTWSTEALLNYYASRGGKCREFETNRFFCSLIVTAEAEEKYDVMTEFLNLNGSFEVVLALAVKKL